MIAHEAFGFREGWLDMENPSFGKSLEMSISLYFAYINSYMHTIIRSVSISMDISKMNKFIENLAKLFNKVTSFSCHKKNNAIVPDNPNSREYFPQFGS